MDAVTFGETRTIYHGRKEKVAIVTIGGSDINVGLADTARCAVDLEVAKAVMAAFAARAGVPASTIEGTEFGLQAHCRQLTKWKPRLPRY